MKYLAMLVCMCLFFCFFVEGVSAVDWSDNFNSGNQTSWNVINGGDNSTYVFQNNRYELHTEGATAKSLASYVNIINNNSISQVRIQKINSSDNFLVYLLARTNIATMSGYVCGISSDGAHFWLGKLTGGVYSALPTTGSASYNSSDFIFRCAVFDNKIVAKVWNSSSTEPSAWQINSTDNSYTTGSNGIMLATYPTLSWNNVQAAFDDINVTSISKSITYVDDDWAGNVTNTEVASGKIFGYNAFSKIQDAINNVTSGGVVNVAAGNYDEQVYINKSITLEGAGDTTIIKPFNLTKYLTTPSVAGSTVCTGAVIVNNSAGAVIIQNLKVDASSLDTNRTKWFSPNVGLMKFAGVFYYNSNGTIDNVISMNTNNITIAATGATTWGRQVQSFKIDANATTGIFVEIKNSKASNFLGEAISVGWNTPTATQTVNIQNNTIIGDGSVTNRRQNGIYVYYGFNVTAISYNTINDLVYRSGTNWATGITVADVKSGAMIEYNNITNCDFGITDTYSSGVTIQHNTITGSDQIYGTGIYIDNSPASITDIVVHANTIGSGFTYGGISLRGWYAGSNTINETITDNILTGDGTNDGYGIYDDSGAAGAISSVITGNTITGWTKGISIETGAPVNGITIKDNLISENIVYNLHDKATNIINATFNWWGSAVKSVIQSNISGNVTFEPYYTNVEMTILSTAPDINGSSTITNTTTQVVISNSTQNVTVTIENGTTNATIDVSSLVTNGNGTIPQIIINSNLANVTIPATNITCTNSSWNGVIAAPTVTTITVPNTATETMTTSTAINIGFADAQLSFDNAVRVLFPGQKDKRVGYSRSGISFTEITATCGGDSQAIGDALGVDGNCKLTIGDDLIVWTKHFTTFATFSSVLITSTPIITSSGTGGGSGGSPCVYNPNYDWACAEWSSCINGTQTRSCSESNNCGNVYGRPETTITCGTNITSPSKLFDIRLDLDSISIKTSNELNSVTTFTSFGTVPTFVDLTYSILDSSGNEVYSEKGNVTVTTEQIVRKNFENLNLLNGKYTLILTTVYGDNVKDEFKQDFSVGETGIFQSPKSSWIIFIIVLGGVVIDLIVVSRLIYLNRKKTQRQKK